MSWKCCQCGEEHLDQFDMCWKCGGDLNGEPSPSCATDFEQLSDSERNDLLVGREPLHWSEMDGSSLLQTNGNPETQSSFGIPERPPPTPFRKRLNAYFHRDADESIPQDTFRSRMPFLDVAYASYSHSCEIDSTHPQVAYAYPPGRSEIAYKIVTNRLTQIRRLRC
jgi:hypothetical protein